MNVIMNTVPGRAQFRVVVLAYSIEHGLLTERELRRSRLMKLPAAFFERIRIVRKLGREGRLQEGKNGCLAGQTAVIIAGDGSRL